jgi:hypothetical protein
MSTDLEAQGPHTAHGRETGRDGCDCPWWIERCAHLDGDQRLWMFRIDVTPDVIRSRGYPDFKGGNCPECDRPLPRVPSSRRSRPVEYRIEAGRFEAPWCACKIPLTIPMGAELMIRCETQDEAIAVFYEHQARLLAPTDTP